MKIQISMKRFLLQTILGVFVAVQSSLALNVPELAAPLFADTEVSTNVAMMAWAENTRQFNVTLQFDATPSNNIQVAFLKSLPVELMPRTSRSWLNSPTTPSSCC